MANTNIETTSALRAIELLRQYNSATNQAEKDDLLKQLYDVDGFAHAYVTAHNVDPLILADKMEKAIKLDRYRPKNMSIAKLAMNKDLDNIGGEFDTFDSKIEQMFKNKEDPNKIRDKFRAATANIHVLAKQFSADWIQRLNNHKELAEAARNAKDNEAVDAYDRLFDALAKDFCDEYNCVIDSKVITDWATSDVKPKDGWDISDGYTSNSYNINFPSNVSKAEQKKIVEKANSLKGIEFRRFLDNISFAVRKSSVRVNITNVKKLSDKESFFYKMISIFAHEMHHALDYQKPRQGALGPQISEIDSQIKVSATQDGKAYLQGATEISSYKIDHVLFDQLKNTRF